MSDANSRPLPSPPIVQRVSFGDLADVLRLGWSDYVAAPMFGLFFSAIYVASGIVLAAAAIHFAAYWLLYPLVVGFALIGPFVAAGLYEVSRRREQRAALNWNEVLGVVWHQRRRELGWMAFVMLFVFWVWLYQARTIFAVFFGFQGFASIEGFLVAILTTTNGWLFLLVGHLVGAVIALALFSVTVVSCPLLLDRDVDFVTAMITSINAVFNSPIVMIFWGLFVILCVIISAIPGFLGLLISLPVLGHATWHLYRRAVAASP